MNGRDITQLGYREGPIVGLALRIAKRAIKQMPREQMNQILTAILTTPEKYASDHLFGDLATAVIEERDRPYWVERESPAPYEIWGEGLEKGALDQMAAAVRLPVAVRGALMPDAHQGYGLPIGGVLATQDAVIPYAVGVDIACRMKLSVFDIPADQLARLNDTLINALNRETLFGAGAHFRRPLQHDVLDEDWSVTKITQHLFDKARTQLGTSGSGNHFVEVGTITFEPARSGNAAGSPYLAASCRTALSPLAPYAGARLRRTTPSWRAIFIRSCPRN